MNRLQKCAWIIPALALLTVTSSWPTLSALSALLGVDQATVRKVLAAWGPGKFDAELVLDGKGFRPDGKSAAVLIPPAFGLAGVNLHTWTGWGSVTHWNAFVANLEMHGKGTFFDPKEFTRHHISFCIRSLRKHAIGDDSS